MGNVQSYELWKESENGKMIGLIKDEKFRNVGILGIEILKVGLCLSVCGHRSAVQWFRKW